MTTTPHPTDSALQSMPVTATTRGRRKQPALALNKQLVLKRWLLQLFGVTEFTDFTTLLSRLEHDGDWHSAEGMTPYVHVLMQLPDRKPRVTDTLLYAYDERVLRDWQTVTHTGDEAGNPLQLKYFQYMALLFTEIYLDAYFSDPVTLQNDLNTIVHAHNQAEGTALPAYTADDLRKLAFWQATGSGKTHIMHVNILQYLRYARLHKRMPDLVILLTPNEALSHQHLSNLRRAGFSNARIFKKEHGSSDRILEIASDPQTKIIEIIDINKLGTENGDKTVAVSTFEGNNLVLVDEGHRGSSGQEWMELRRQLVTNGFSCEYSATFGQAFRASNDPALTAEYAKCIIIDYSYRYFYEDGYGKDFSILNLRQQSRTLTDGQNDDDQFGYLVGSLLTFYQQMKYYDDHTDVVQQFKLQRPFMIFVGGSVTRSVNKDEVSDVADIVRFFARFMANAQQQQVIKTIQRILYDDSFMLDEEQRNVFANRFLYLKKHAPDPLSIHTDIMQRLFNATKPGHIAVELLRKATGEIALRVGDGEPFGVINVGDPAGLIKAIEAAVPADQVRALDNEYSESLFHAINAPRSALTMLIGSRKFTEGWSSFRVSCMGLMKIGKNEGTQIIQLFGRGVRLMGYQSSLKRSAVLADGSLLQIPRPAQLEILETLNVFGVHANYMAEFKAIMTAEEVRGAESYTNIVVPTRRNFDSLPPVHVIGIKRGTVQYEKTGTPNLLRVLQPEESPRPIHVTRDYYPRLQSMFKHSTKQSYGDEGNKHEGILTHGHCVFLDFAALYHDLVAYKRERGWHTLVITPEQIRDLLDPGPLNPTDVKGKWYKLFAPPEAFAFSGMANVALWQRMAFDLLTGYCDVFHKNRRASYQADYLEYQPIGESGISNDNLLAEYTLRIGQDAEPLVNAVQKIVESYTTGQGTTELAENSYQLGSLHFERHLYSPLFSLPDQNTYVQVIPTPMNAGERRFIEDLRTYHNTHADFFRTSEMYVLRNRSRGHGIGFFNAGNFYPDFVLWVIHGGTQYITFVDPKGLVRILPDDPKIEFHRTIKDVESQLHERRPDIRVVLNSCIISVSRHETLQHWRNTQNKSMSLPEFNAKHVFFQKDQPGSDYIGRIFAIMGIEVM